MPRSILDMVTPAFDPTLTELRTLGEWFFFFQKDVALMQHLDTRHATIDYLQDVILNVEGNTTYSTVIEASRAFRL